MGNEGLDARRTEFEAHVWDHAQDVFQTSFDLRAPLDAESIAKLNRIADAIADGADDDALAQVLQREMSGAPEFLLIVLQLVGLTREKPRSDLRAPLAALGLRLPGKVIGFLGSASWRLAGTYFAKRVRSVFINVVPLSTEQRAGAFEALNQATWPGYIRQERAKRSGGYAEQRVAILLKSLDIPFTPEKKAENGLTADVTIAGESFDLAIPDATRPAVCIMSMAHSSNIGQYGESKAGDTGRAKAALEQMETRPLLGVFADGVGFYSNSAGLNGVLKNADEFFQFETLWKVAVIAAAATGKRLVLVLPDAEQHREFLRRYHRTVDLRNKIDSRSGWVETGEAMVRIA